VLSGLALIVMAMSVLLSLSRSGVACLAATVLGFACFAVGKMARPRRVLVTLYFAIAITLCAGWATTDGLAARFGEFQNDGLGRRVGAWRDARQISSAFPLVGSGLNTFGVATLFHQTTNRDEHYEEAHNDYLQLAAEGGVLLTAPAVLLIVLIAVNVAHRFKDQHDTEISYWIRAGAVTGLLAIGLQEVGEFSRQMPGTAALCSVLLAISLHRPPIRHTATSAHRSGRHRVRMP
jgi:O-antigen ligase